MAGLDKSRRLPYTYMYNGNPCLPATSDFYGSQPLRELTIGNVGIDHLSGVNNAIKIRFLDVSQLQGCHFQS